jgi:hypothetical protein
VTAELGPEQWQLELTGQWVDRGNGWYASNLKGRVLKQGGPSAPVRRGGIKLRISREQHWGEVPLIHHPVARPVSSQAQLVVTSVEVTLSFEDRMVQVEASGNWWQSDEPAPGEVKDLRFVHVDYVQVQLPWAAFLQVLAGVEYLDEDVDDEGAG